MTDMSEPAPHVIFARLESEFQRVGVSLETPIEVSRLVAGPPPPNIPPPPTDSFTGDLGAFQDVLQVLESLPDQAGRAAFVSAMKSAWGIS